MVTGLGKADSGVAINRAGPFYDVSILYRAVPESARSARSPPVNAGPAKPEHGQYLSERRQAKVPRALMTCRSLASSSNDNSTSMWNSCLAPSQGDRLTA